MKGYELYAWQDGNTVAYALMTGTNRQKTAQEVLSAASQRDPTGWVIVRGSGIPSLQEDLQLVPPGPDVIFVDLEGLPPLNASQRAEITALVPTTR